MKQILDIARALADANRLKAVICLGAGELCACQIVIMLGNKPSTVSRHMSILRRAGLVESRKEGLWVHYRLAANGRPPVREALAWVKRHCKSDENGGIDEKKLKKVRRMNQKDLCRYYTALLRRKTL